MKGNWTTTPLPRKEEKKPMSKDLELVERVIKLASSSIRRDSSFMRMCELAKHAAEADIEIERLKADLKNLELKKEKDPDT